MQARDLDKVSATLTSGDMLVLILPDGRYTTTKAAYLDFHRAWFASKSWTMDFEPIWQKQSTTMGQVLLRTRYQDSGPPTVDTRSYLMLTFEREASDWKLIADQNTRFQA
ncbi:MAG: hypothetical protein JNJ73_05095 [Hyphomonadaceae bacterium]|nr:hypothetical protein [Hyphomonadaceae bacterium]